MRRRFLKFLFLMFIIFIILYIFNTRLFAINFLGYIDIESKNNFKYEIYEDKGYEYYYELLSDKEKVVYNNLKKGLLSFNDKIYSKGVGIDYFSVNKIVLALQNDHPEIFWYDSVKFLSPILEINKYKFNFVFSKEEAIKKKNDMALRYNQIIEDANKLEGNYEKIKFVHDKLLEIGDYDNEANYSSKEYQSMISIFTTGKTVCNGFASSFKFIMDNLDIKSYQIIGENINNQSYHVWNAVYLDDKWLYLDLTWDDVEEDKYKYFLLDKEDFNKLHNIIDKEVEENG